MSKGWFILPGQDGDRTLTEQMLGLAPAILETRGKTVLDLGCAEGLIALEFAKSGAASVYGIDYNEALLDVARDELVKAGPLPVQFERADISEMVNAEARPQWDIVLALAVLHKLTNPEAGARFCAASSRSLIVVRYPMGSQGRIRGKHAPDKHADVPVILKECGFKRERKDHGPRGEWVHYFRKC